MEVPEKIEEVVEEAKEQVEEIISNPVLQRKEVLAGLAGVAGLLIGGVGGYILGKRRGEVTVIEGTLEVTEEEFKDPNQLTLDLNLEEYKKVVAAREAAIEELNKAEEAKGHIRRPSDETPEPVILRHQEPDVIVDEVVAEVDIVEVEEVDPEQAEFQRVNAFAQSGDDWDFEAEKANREGKAIYVIHRDEFLEDEAGMHQQVLTYYEGDDILSDENDQPVFNIEQTIGPFMWGHGSNDPNVYYVRNHNRNGEYEVLRHTGRFGMEVLGLEEDGEAPAGVRKFRPGRDE